MTAGGHIAGRDEAVTARAEFERPHAGASIAEWLTTTEHKRIGLLYIAAAFGFYLLGGGLATLMRTELAQPGLQLMGEETYNELFTMHGTLMMLVFGTPMAAGFANFLLPLQIGAADMAF